MQLIFATEFQLHQTPSISRRTKYGLEDHRPFINSDNLNALPTHTFRMRKLRNWMHGRSNAVFPAPSLLPFIVSSTPIPAEYSPHATSYLRKIHSFQHTPSTFPTFKENSTSMASMKLLT